jgi:hypothetical protein
MRVLGTAAGLLLAAGGAWAHHSIAASFDDSKPVTVQGTVTRFEWSNPHVYVWVDQRASNGTVTEWAIEFDGRTDLKRFGWRQDSVRVGDTVTVQGILARDSNTRASGRSLQVAGGATLAAAPREMPPLAPARSGKAKETPRWPDGHPILGTAPGERGFWADASPAALHETTAGNIRMNREGLLANINDAGKVAPFLPWAKALYEYRQRVLLRDDPMAFCLPPGGARQMQDRYGVQIFEQVERKRVFVLSGGGNRNWRIIDTDGRALPVPEEVTPTYYGYSTGRWEGDTFVVESTAYTERFWFTNGGLPHTESLRLTERFTRPDHDTLRYEVTVDDPATYSRPWTAVTTLSWVPDADIDEYFCDDNNKETEHLSGKHDATEP